MLGLKSFTPLTRKHFTVLVYPSDLLPPLIKSTGNHMSQPNLDFFLPPPKATYSWSDQDIEQRLFFSGGRFTKVNGVLAGLLGLFLAGVTYGSAFIFPKSRFAEICLERGPTPCAIIILFWCSMAILFIKWRKLCLQRKLLDIDIIPAEKDFVLSSETVDEVTGYMIKIVDNPKYFVLYNRINVALSNLRNLGRVGDIDDILRAQADQDRSAMETSYGTLQAFVWAIPVLGFIGTVLGLSEAIGTFGSVLEASDDLTQISSSLQGVTGGLATAFETTLIALIAALIIQLTMTTLKKSEEEFLDNAMDYCIRNVVGRLRLINR